jgi:hypothetical protein
MVIAYDYENNEAVENSAGDARTRGIKDAAFKL